MNARPPMPRDPFRVTPQELQEYRRLFDIYDVNHTGFLEASVAAEYLTQSRLPQPILHNIWELADRDHDGLLSEYEFIIATHVTKLVQKRNIPIPSTLPPALLEENLGKEVIKIPPEKLKELQPVDMDDSKLSIEELRSKVEGTKKDLLDQEKAITEKSEESRQLTSELCELEKQLADLNKLIAMQEDYDKTIDTAWKMARLQLKTTR
ncbi:uncharacterized protein [Blastocystis hominis]|uniref:Uncharacterized protein n=1 Tax=Blastocystis hominis TaxID=12968 RepID=D8M666_BLAHO|nr:uncharacterized protein [Blastocystis hominis]CBK23775.2 unnamed protein product [Blastocystis hominis]|eukprot:XP_012897823.1 uncharacterized protein [Blastocystis hominis]